MISLILDTVIALMMNRESFRHCSYHFRDLSLLSYFKLQVLRYLKVRRNLLRKLRRGSDLD